METYEVVELFESINGEGRKAGQLAQFVRFHGCNLNCSYCDTRWANERDAPFTEMTAEEIAARLTASGICNVTLTGGEPLAQRNIELLLERLAAQEDLQVEIETNGSIPLAPFMQMRNRPSMTMDYKLPASGMERFMCLYNLQLLQAQDTLKFVCKSREDLERAAEILREYELCGRCAVYFSPVFGELAPKDMVDFLKENRLNGVNLQLQLHKFIWDPMERGV